LILFNFNVDNFCWNCFCRRTVPTGYGQHSFGSSLLACSLVLLVFLGGVQLKPKPATFPVDDIAMMMMKPPNHHNSNLMASMYGGVITPLALVHQQIRQQNHQQQMGGPLVQLRPVGRSNSGGSGSRDRQSPMQHDPLHPARFHPLSEEILVPPLIPPPPLPPTTPFLVSQRILTCNSCSNNNNNNSQSSFPTLSNPIHLFLDTAALRLAATATSITHNKYNNNKRRHCRNNKCKISVLFQVVRKRKVDHLCCGWVSRSGQ
jgi:hypothetical protein